MQLLICLFCLFLVSSCGTTRALVSDCQNLDGSDLKNCKLEKKL